jgi:hypothetical protein
VIGKSRQLFIFILVTLALMSTAFVSTAQDTGGDPVCPMTVSSWVEVPDEWPVSSLTLGNQVYNAAELYALLTMDADGDASILLAQQLIAAKLSAAAGTDTTIVNPLIAEADESLAMYDGKLPYDVDEDDSNLVVIADTFQVFSTGAFHDDCETVPDPEVTETPEPDIVIDTGDDSVIIVVEGPVQAINVNVITIYDIDIVVEEDDPSLTVIQIGDVLRITGELVTDGDELVLIGDNLDSDDDFNLTIVIIAVNIIFVDVDVFILDGQVWRDAGNCQNPPPAWAPAHGWRRRCAPQGGGSRRGSRRNRS